MLPAAFFVIRGVGFHRGWRGLCQNHDSAAHHGKGACRQRQHCAEVAGARDARTDQVIIVGSLILGLWLIVRDIYLIVS